ncbi:hypothetical protein GMI69_07790 [Eggerthellaceae bacterium zg-887]|uniref:molecular chaperone TorD family protein n=1 Tax=Xiamenia xianingshaonis TaxID=2682776 RepID=UPI00140976BD|nr:molecular chaperone TorD family protein [Xiamenia xianingshaonis]NHM16556.1 hypothetical protein [Xiamenia xianingshaonis]
MTELKETGEVTEAQGLDELAVLMDGVAASYGLLSRLYLKEPDDETVAALRRMRFPAHTGNEFLDRGYCQIVGYLSRTGAAAVEELRADYSRTFIGGGIDSRSAARLQATTLLPRETLVKAVLPCVRRADGIKQRLPGPFIPLSPPPAAARFRRAAVLSRLVV